jgi:Zn-finger nucleic acid-binding protein
MICPVCNDAMIVIEYHDIELDYCNKCKGVWFDSGELELMLKSQGLEESKELFRDILRSREAVSSEKKRNCPVCHHKMKKTVIGGQPEILIDVCPDKHGLWFDGGEVTQLIRQLAEKRPPRHDSRAQIIGFLEEVFKGPEQTTGN